jgi:GAF domain-containing protein
MASLFHSADARESRRLAALYETGILHTERTDSFDRICELARRVMNVPYASIAFVDESKVWFKCNLGVNLQSIDRKSSFASHALDSDEVFVVEDATKDPRFASFPDVLGPPHLRFFAAAPIVLARDIRVGVVAVKDRRPRTLDAIDKDALGVLASLARTQLQLLAVSRSLRDVYMAS